MPNEYHRPTAEGGSSVPPKEGETPRARGAVEMDTGMGDGDVHTPYEQWQANDPPREDWWGVGWCGGGLFVGGTESYI